MEIFNFNKLNGESLNSYKRYLITQSNLNATILDEYSSTLYGINLDDWKFYLGASNDELLNAIRSNSTVLEQTAAQIVLIFEVYTLGIHVFGNKSKFNHWLINGRSEFDGIQPRRLLTNPLGIICLEKELQRMKKPPSPNSKKVIVNGRKENRAIIGNRA